MSALPKEAPPEDLFPRRDPLQRIDDEQRWESTQRKHHFLAGACVLLFCAILAMAWYAYPMLKQHEAALVRLPGLTQTMDNLRDEIEAVKQRAADSANAQNSLQQSLREQSEKIARDLRARIDDASRRAALSAEEAYSKIEARIDSELKSQSSAVADLSDRVSTLESSHAADQTQIAVLRQQLDQVRGQVSQQSEELARIRQQMDESSSGANRQIEALRRDQSRDRRDVDAISDKIAVEKLPFEASKDHNRDLGDGITLYVSGTDIEHRRVSGWMWVANDRRTIWLRGQSAQEPVIFYGYPDGQKHEVVFTNVTKNSVTGYLLLPKQVAPALAQASPAGE